jgi:ribosomal protein S18 acetylase RimI-like enzyme
MVAGKEVAMSSYLVRRLAAGDFETLCALEREIFGAAGETLLCPHYLRLCCEMFADSCFLAFDGTRPIGYLLGFVKDRSAHCATLAVVAEYQRGRATAGLVRAFVRAIIDRVDECWFTVKEDNTAARAMHAYLGAKVVARRRDYYGPGDERLLSLIDREGVERMRARYQRLGAVGERDAVVSEAA